MSDSSRASEAASHFASDPATPPAQSTAPSGANAAVSDPAAKDGHMVVTALKDAQAASAEVAPKPFLGSATPVQPVQPEGQPKEQPKDPAPEAPRPTLQASSGAKERARHPSTLPPAARPTRQGV